VKKALANPEPSTHGTREELRKLAAVYIARAEQFESKELLEPASALSNLFNNKRIYG
jgi:hypothetical protein